MTEELLSTAVAAEALHELDSSKTVDQWAYFLQNNRNRARKVGYRIPFDKIAGAAFYQRGELLKFVEWDRARQIGTIKLTGRAAEVVQAFGIGSKGGSATGRALQVSSVHLQVDPASGKPFVQVITAEPLMVYRMEASDAKAFAAELVEAATAAERIAGGQ